MYGYLRYYPYDKRSISYQIYKKYYCGLCQALRVNCNVIASLTLSYDMTLIAIILSPPSLNICCSQKCSMLKRKKCISKDFKVPFWTALSEVNFALIYAKLYDNYIDERNIKSKFALSLFSIIFMRNSRVSFQLWELFKKRMDELSNIEHSIDVYEQGYYTANMILEGLRSKGIEIDNAKKEFLTVLTQWVCLIDAIDDFDEDNKKKRYNPLLNSFTINGNYTKYSFIAKYYTNIAYLHNHLSSQLKELIEHMQLANDVSVIIQEMINIQMPNKFSNIMKKGCHYGKQ